MHVTIVVNGQKHEVGGRAAQIILWLLNHLEQINEYGGEAKGAIRITYKKGDLTASLTQIDKLNNL